MFFGVVITLNLVETEIFSQFLMRLGDYGYLSAFVAGMMFSSTFTITIGGLILLALVGKLSAIEIGLIAGLGAMFNDFLMLKFVKSELKKELCDLYNTMDKELCLEEKLHLKYLTWTMPIIGGLIMISPLPDEIGVGLLGLSKMKTYKFALISYCLHTTGIILLVSLVSAIK